MNARASILIRALPLLLLAAACTGAEPDAGNTTPDAAAAADTAPQTATPPAASRGDPTGQIACVPQRSIEGRASPYDSTVVPLGDAQAKICYNRPSARGRTMLGGELPFGTVWRTGANEPTILHLPVAARIAGIDVGPGSYSIYTIPGESEWTVLVNRSTSQWGAAPYADIEAQEAGRATVPAESTSDHIEQFTIRAEPAGQAANLILEWERTRITIPVERS